ncbi:enoyl-CoA hydratase-related protein [Telmatospirillum sp.]|uniref:enoyl-CoA hydratase-related protein n=1 Tax=Telmatospirillum sp. TaxID=2079197 RepID=UPI00283C6BC6|nr:enoyl-CoA hydratase-related protein [Telmatospirillum sp.]MDR3436098.1 enoyl-CoA hydratase-related protein [Telmatospirillum sp.]
MTDLIVTERDGFVQTVRMNRPEKKNALTLAMYGGLADALAKGETDDDVSVHLLAGGGEDFTAGNDLNDFLTITRLSGTDLERFLLTLAGLQKPVVAAVKGAAVGIGSTMLLHCDLIVAAAESRFQFPFVNLGLVPEAASSLLLPRLVGHPRAAELLMLGDPFDAARAYEIGLVNSVVPTGEEEQAARALADRLAARPRDAVRKTKALLRQPDEPVLDRIQREARIFEAALTSPELREAVAAFRERRPADFTRHAR